MGGRAGRDKWDEDNRTRSNEDYRNQGNEPRKPARLNGQTPKLDLLIKEQPQREARNRRRKAQEKDTTARNEELTKGKRKRANTCKTATRRGPPAQDRRARARTVCSNSTQ
ncbi:hypothetical protein NDU88_006879 [Pleurodeles waltl]|uniref:Uncharacterized protein n=1 Tax=Pleurodeles waltl TaxID=8319 RepID=A0AAV7QK34_PLEWA|nr:hypothetical protein NDU88_006879 [Pleurodeles waltl]